MITMVIGIIGGWIRLGWDIDFPNAAGYHGLLMVGGFMGGLITLERTITMKNKSWLIFPIVCVVASGFFLFDRPIPGMYFLIIASAGLSAFYLVQMKRHDDPYWYLLLGGAICWLIGNIRILQTGLVPTGVHWWVGFILFTILGERLELTRFLPVTKKAKIILWTLMAILGVGFLLPFHAYGKIIYVPALILSIAWYVKNDMARYAIRKPGYHRYTGMGMLTAYGWLLVHAVISLLPMGYLGGYDLYIHTFFLGFGFSMIWAHAPMILPAILKLTVRPFHRILWIFWAVFQGTLLLRVIVSLVPLLNDFKRLFGLMNGISILMMFGVMVFILVVKNRGSIQKRAITNAISHS